MTLYKTNNKESSMQSLISLEGLTTSPNLLHTRPKLVQTQYKSVAQKKW